MSANASDRKDAGTPRRGSSAKTGKVMTPSERRVQVAAARLRVTLDQRLGRQTPAETKELAKEDY